MFITVKYLVFLLNIHFHYYLHTWTIWHFNQMLVTLNLNTQGTFRNTIVYAILDSNYYCYVQSQNDNYR